MPNSLSSELSDGLEQRVSSLEDLAAIQKLKSRYVFSVDKCFVSPSRENAVATVDLFTDGAVADFGNLGRYEGRAQLLNAFENVFPSMASWTTHYVTNPMLDVAGDEARGEWHFLVYVVFKGAPPGPPQNIWGHYTERYVRTASGWKIASLVAEFFSPPAP